MGELMNQAIASIIVNLEQKITFVGPGRKKVIMTNGYGQRILINITIRKLNQIGCRTEHTLETGEHSLGTGEHTLETGEHTLGTGEHSLERGEHTLGTGEHTLESGEHTLETSEHSLESSEHSLGTGEHTLESSEHSLGTGEHTLESSQLPWKAISTHNLQHRRR